MKSFVKYDKNDKNLSCDDNNLIPVVCNKYIKDDYKKCKKHYDELISEGKECNKICPYGFYTFFRENNIYTSIILQDENYNDMKIAYKGRGLKLQEKNSFFTKEQALSIIDDIEKIEKDTKSSRECMHELSNIGGYINSMQYQIKEKYADLIEQDDDIRAMLCLYDMINYRLSLSNNISEINYKKDVLKTHPMLDKLRILMSYQAKKKNIQIKLAPSDLYIEGSKNLYLALFILIDNAIKNSPAGGEVSIYYNNITSTEVNIIIENRGPIVEKSEINKLTINGYRGKNVKCNGQGIGLSIFDKICKKADYKYNIETKDINREECLFMVTITLKRKTHDDYLLKHDEWY